MGGQRNPVLGTIKIPFLSRALCRHSLQVIRHHLALRRDDGICQKFLEQTDPLIDWAGVREVGPENKRNIGKPNKIYLVCKTVFQTVIDIGAILLLNWVS